MQIMSVSLAFAIRTPSRLSPFVAWLVWAKIIVSASSWVQMANSSRSIMWLLVKSSFDINVHFLSLFLRKMRQLDGSLHLFDTLHLTNVLAWADLASIFKLFDLYTSNTMSVLLWLAKCACIAERTSNVTYSSNVLELFGDLVLMMAAWYAPYLLYCVIKHDCDIRTSGHPSSECGSISSHTSHSRYYAQ